MRSLQSVTKIGTRHSDPSDDLRRVKNLEISDLVRERSVVLEPTDAALMQAVYVAGQPVSSVAAMLHEPPRMVRKQIKRLLKRLRTREFGFVFRNRERWTRVRREVATAIFIHGRTIRQAAEELGLTFYAARRHRDAVRALIEGGDR